MTTLDRSPWREEQQPSEFPSLGCSRTVDVAIIGGGMTGLTAAYLLRHAGKSIAVLEQHRIGDWATGSTTGFLMDALDVDPTELIKEYGEKEAKQITSSHTNAISTIEKIAAEEDIICEFKRCPAYLYAQTKKEAQALKEEADACANVGLTAAYSEESLPFQTCGHIRLENQAKFHPLKYLFGLAEALRKSDVQIYEQTKVTAVHRDAMDVTLALANGQSVIAQHVLIATHNPLPEQPFKLFFKKAWYTTYVIEAELPVHTLPEGLYEDSRIPYHYMRIDRTKEGDRLLLGGEDHRSDIYVDERKNFDALEAYLKELLPSTTYAITREWKGRIVEPGDGLPYIGPLHDPRVFYATGYSGSGLTAATIAAQLFRDHVLGISNPLQAIYAANRPFSLQHHLPKALEYIEELWRGAVKNTFLH